MFTLREPSPIKALVTNTKSKVFFLTWDEKDRLAELIEKSGMDGLIDAKDFVAIKMHFGEKGSDGYIKPEFVRPFIKAVQQKRALPYLADTGTIYSGLRSNAVDHLNLAAQHGFSHTKLGTPIIIADGLVGNDYVNVPIEGTHFKAAKIATGIRNAHVLIVLSHFKGHLLGGFGGTIKNLGMGCGARIGKFEMHSSVSPSVNTSKCTACGTCVARCSHCALSLNSGKISLDPKLCAGCGECVVVCKTQALSISWSDGAKLVQEKYAEYALGAVKGKRTIYFNFLNHMTANCDCMSKGEKPLLDDIGILASSDPVAIDQASFDMVFDKAGNVFSEAHGNIDPLVQLEHAEKIGLGSRTYVVERV